MNQGRTTLAMSPMGRAILPACTTSARTLRRFKATVDRRARKKRGRA